MSFNSVLIMLHSTTSNFAVNSSDEEQLMIMIWNNFVELKGSFFKKFDKNNLFQLSCSDVRERFHLFVLLLIVVIQTMKEFSWKQEQFFEMLPPCSYVLITELFIDWIKHAFITRFNEIPCEVYKEYTLSLAYDMTQTRQKHAFSDHSDLVARRMGFIPFPLAVVLFKAGYHAITFNNVAAVILFVIGFLALCTLRVVNTIYALGKACELMEQHTSSLAAAAAAAAAPPFKNPANYNTSTPMEAGVRPLSNNTDTATSPLHSSYPIQRSKTVDTVPELRVRTSSVSMTPCEKTAIIDDSANLGATAIFSNSDVDLDDVHLNENILSTPATNNNGNAAFDPDLTRSVPDLQKNQDLKPGGGCVSGGGGNCLEHEDDDDECEVKKKVKRTHRRSESEPFIQNIQS